VADRDLPPFANDPDYRGGTWRSYVGIAFDVFGRRAGSIGFLARDPRPGGFAHEEVELVRLMGALVGSALERASHEAKLDEMAFFDALTHLPNRAMLYDRVQQTLFGAKRSSRAFAVLYLDLDGFKRVNDQYGHPVGDVALQITADRLRATVRESDTVARIGGDEFVVVQPFATDVDDAVLLGSRIISAIEAPYDIPGAPDIQLSASVGVAMYPADGTEVDELLAAADAALYRAKEAGKHRVAAAGRAVAAT
jgi:diguanylate cyclase (GGDEF)-like protein